MELSKLESTKEYEILTKINPQKILYCIALLGRDYI